VRPSLTGEPSDLEVGGLVDANALTAGVASVENSRFLVFLWLKPNFVVVLEGNPLKFAGRCSQVPMPF